MNTQRRYLKEKKRREGQGLTTLIESQGGFMRVSAIPKELRNRLRGEIEKGRVKSYIDEHYLEWACMHYVTVGATPAEVTAASGWVTQAPPTQHTPRKAHTAPSKVKHTDYLADWMIERGDLRRIARTLPNAQHCLDALNACPPKGLGRTI